MATMQAVLLDDDRNIVLGERAVPEPRADQVLLAVDLCGICGSDLHSPELPQVYRGGFVLGHETSGLISWVGPDVAGWQVGQRVAVNPNGNVCGACEYCRTGRPNFCFQATMQTALGLQADGGLAPVMAVSPKTLRRVPEGMGRVEAAWVEPTATALRAVGMAGGLTDLTVLVSGGGPIGQLACRIAAYRGARRIILIEPAAERRAFAQASHADLALTPAQASTQVTAQDDPLRVDVVIECSGNSAATALALSALRPGGIFIVVGSGIGSGLDPALILLKEVTVRGSFTYAYEFDEAIELLGSGGIRVADLTTAVVPLRDALAAFSELKAARTMKILIDPRETAS